MSQVIFCQKFHVDIIQPSERFYSTMLFCETLKNLFSVKKIKKQICECRNNLGKMYAALFTF